MSVFCFINQSVHNGKFWARHIVVVFITPKSIAFFFAQPIKFNGQPGKWGLICSGSPIHFQALGLIITWHVELYLAPQNSLSKLPHLSFFPPPFFLAMLVDVEKEI